MSNSSGRVEPLGFSRLDLLQPYTAGHAIDVIEILCSDDEEEEGSTTYQVTPEQPKRIFAGA